MPKTIRRSLASPFLTLVLVSLGSTAPLSAQTSPAAPQQPSAANAMAAPPVLWIERQTVSPDNKAAFIDTIHKQLDLFHEHQVVFRVLGLAGAAPDMNEFLFLIHFNSFAEMDQYEERSAAMPAEYQKRMQELVDQEAKLSQFHQVMAAVFRPDLSYRADAGAVAKARLLWTCQFIVPAGHMPEFESDIHFLSDLYAKAGVDDHFFLYQTLAGAESTTFLVLRPLKALADWDKPAPALDKFLDDAGKFRLAHIWKDESLSGPGTSVERLYVLRPDLSQTSDKFASFNPDFWHPKKQ
jgi:hypothetical protein